MQNTQDESSRSAEADGVPIDFALDHLRCNERLRHDVVPDDDNGDACSRQHRAISTSEFLDCARSHRHRHRTRRTQARIRRQDDEINLRSNKILATSRSSMVHRRRALRQRRDNTFSVSPTLITVLMIYMLSSPIQQQQDIDTKLASDDANHFHAPSSGIHQHPVFMGAYAFNIDTQSAVVHQGAPGSYFGYSVAQHKDRGVSWLLVGAPKAQTDQRGTRESGAVYKCSPNYSKTCQQIAFDTNGSSVIQLRGESKQSDDKSHQWFGASLHSANDNGSIIACAPSYVYYSTNLKRRDPVGTCWVSRGSFTGFFEYSPCRLNDQWGHHHLGSCQAGFASAITKDGSRILIGAPGSHVWQGQVFAHNLKTDLHNATSGVNPHSEDDSYLGYSIALGHFSSNNYAAEDAAIGMPKGNDLAGKIVIVDREMRVMRNLTGEQMGSYFGYSLATADVNGDGLDDLIVGAPLYYNQTISHKEPHFERGRVYVALQTPRHEFNIVARLDGARNRARFGTAVANCGDLNRDGYQDIAVGAPYDGPDGKGAVYIYMGKKSGGVSEEHDQVIYAAQVRGEGQYMRSFGFSLSGGLDLDNNQYPDLLVGDYEADRAVLFRTRPVINVTTSLVFQPEHFNLDDKTCLLPNMSVSCITVQYCLKYNGLNVDNKLNFVFDIKLDTENKGAPRLFFLNQPNKNEERNSSTISKDVNKCNSFKAYILRQVRDKLTPLKVDIDYNLVDFSGDTFDSATGQTKLKPVLNKSAGNRMSKEATIQKNCGPDNVCVPDLKLTMNPNVDKYTMGSTEKLILDVTVKNYGEDAFESMFYLEMPMSVDFKDIDKTGDYPVCHGPKPEQTGTNVLTCDLGNPQARNDVVKFSVITEPAAHGQFTEPDFTFLAHVNSTNAEQDDRHRGDNQVEIGIPIKVDYNLVLSGSSNPAQVWHNLTHSTSGQNRRYVSEADLGPEIYHTYQLQNRGPSTIDDIALTILWPSKTKDGKNPLLYLVDEPTTIGKVRCKPADENAINPLKTKYQRTNQAPGDRTAPAAGSTNRNGGNKYKRQTQTTNPGDANDSPAPLTSSTAAIATTTTTTVDNSYLNQLTQIHCGSNSCDKFECNVYNLGHNDTATIMIRSRLYEDTLNKVSLKDYDISSNLIAQIKSLPYNISSQPQAFTPYQYKVETQVEATGSTSVQDLPLWLLLLAIILGITLFILLACFLKYLGFFARKRPPKGVEREPLTPTMWNDYQYTPGDTAL